MTHYLDRREFLAGIPAAASALALPSRAEETKLSRGLVVGQPEAAKAGTAILDAGGNAIDAIVAAALVAGVVAVPSTGIGGYGGHMIVARGNGQTTAIDFNSTAPAAAKPDMFVDGSGTVKSAIHRHGWLAAGVPGVLAGLQLALDKFGTKSFADLVKPAMRFARDGFAVRKSLANAIRAAQKQFAADPGSRKLFFHGGRPLADGDRFRNPDLADMLSELAGQGRVDDFYRGKIAAKIAAAFRANGGLVTADDLASYRALEVAPHSFTWQSHTILTPPPTSGGLTILQTLGILKALQWSKTDPGEPATVQSRVEAMRIAWTDRLKFLGDPKHSKLPIDRLLSEKYAAECAERVRRAVAAGRPVEGRSDTRPADGTIHLTAADKDGMMVALTFTHGEGFGARVTVDGFGLILGHGMSRFEPRPGHPNSPGPGKRPLHNMCPTIVLKDNKPVLALGATGGRRIPNTVLDVLIYAIVEGRPLADAVAAPRIHTEGDLSLTLEAKWPIGVAARFRELGYRVRIGPGASLNAVARDPATGAYQTAAR